MSNSETFIDEVSDEVRRDKLFATLRKYGWIAALGILALVGGTAWSEYRKAQVINQAQALGDNVLGALAMDSAGERAKALEGIEAGSTSASAILGLLQSAELSESGDGPAAVDRLSQVAVQSETPEIYRQIAAFKAILAGAGTMDAADRRLQLEAMAVAGHPLRLLAQEQIALMDIDAGNADDAIVLFQAILSDAEATPTLQQRAAQAIVALGGTPEMPVQTSNG